MVPGDTDDIKREYEILLNELATFNPEMLEKGRVLAVTKCDLLDEELMDMLRETLPTGITVVFISAVTGFGLQELKDVLWREMNSESNKIAAITTQESIVHHSKDYLRLRAELLESGDDDDEGWGYEEEVPDDDEDYDDIEDLEDFEYEIEED